MNYEIRQSARMQIKRNRLWLSLGLIILIISIMEDVLHDVVFNRAPFDVIIIFIMIAVRAVCVNYSYNIVSDKLQPGINFVDQTNMIVKSFSTRAFLTILLTSLYRLIWLSLCVVGLLWFALTAFETIIYFAGVLGSIILYLIKSYSYFLAPYLSLLDNKPLRSKVALSTKLMKGHKRTLFLLYLSMIPWYLLTVITFGIAMVYTTPYITFAKANFAHKIITNQNKA